MIRKKLLAEVCLLDAVRRPLTYAISDDSAIDDWLGRRVVVPLANRKALGVVTAVDVEYEGVVKPIASAPDAEPVMSATDIDLCRFMADYYLSSLPEAVAAFLPQSLTARLNQHGIITDREQLQQLADSGDAAATKLLALAGNRRKIKATKLAELRRDWRRQLVERGLLQLEWETKRRRHDQRPATVAREANMGDRKIVRPLALRLAEILQSPVESTVAETVDDDRLSFEGTPFFDRPPAATPAFALNREQTLAVERIGSKLQEAQFAAFLLHGVTGSGKTEVYIRAIRHAIALGKQAIVIVPEIGLAQAIYYQLDDIFGERLALIHSRMTASTRFAVWQRARRGQLDVVLGPRSAIFTPFARLGLIIVDEEHDASLKQESPAPRYHARDLAVYRARQLNAVIVLGSATPSIESFHNAQNGKYELLQLPQRIADQPLPLVQRVDLRAAFAQRGFAYLTEPLAGALDATLAAGGQAMLLLNRRGFAPSVHCFQCSAKINCRNCAVAMVYHKAKHCLICHLCGYTESYPNTCPQCKSNLFLYRGIGTEKMEEELRRRYPDVGILRMDFDTTRKAGSFRDLYHRFKSGQAKILLGTQMIAKGFDFPDVALVGIITADTSLELPDFRARERTYQLLTQASGRAGRLNFSGTVILQTLYPNDPIVELAQRQDYESFYEAEIRDRRELKFPPFTHLILLTIESKNAAAAQRAGESLRNRLRLRLTNLATLHGPVAAPIAKLREYFRFHILIKSARIKTVIPILRENLSLPEFHNSRKLRVMADVDPVDMM